MLSSLLAERFKRVVIDGDIGSADCPVRNARPAAASLDRTEPERLGLKREDGRSCDIPCGLAVASELGVAAKRPIAFPPQT